MVELVLKLTDLSPAQVGQGTMSLRMYRLGIFCEESPLRVALCFAAVDHGVVEFKDLRFSHFSRLAGREADRDRRRGATE